MDLIKYCKKEHNIRDRCNTLQLGTFSYYRNMDPDFSIADGGEGSVRYLCRLPEHTEITSKEWNAITGGGVTVRDRISPKPIKPAGAVKFSSTGCEIIYGEDGVAKIKPGSIETELFYPNCYIFCCSLRDPENNVPDPSIVSPDYDSYYEIKGPIINQFSEILVDLVRQNVNVRDVSLDDSRLADSHISTLGIPFNARCIHGPVQYREQNEIVLSGTQDFEETAWSRIFFQSMFWKHASFSTDREYRFVLILEHPVHKFLPVAETPKLINLNRIRSLVT